MKPFAAAAVPRGRQGIPLAAVTGRLAERFTTVVQCLRAVAHGRASPTDVHRLRVSLRRTVAALNLYKQYLPRRRRRWLSKQLNRLRQAAGRVRDCDVLMRLIRDRPLGRGAHVWLSSLRADRRRGLDALAPAADSTSRRRLARRADALVRRVRVRHRRGAYQGTSDFGGWARAWLRPVAARLLTSLPARRPSLKSLHRLRVRVKRLRYAMELVDESLPDEVRAKLYPAVTALQDRLGRLNDLATARTRLRQVVRTAAPEDADALREMMAEICCDLRLARKGFWGSRPQALFRTLKADFERVLAEPAGTGGL